MATNTQVNADHNAPPVTRLLAELVSSHSSKGWDETVETQAHRTFANWAGCAVGPSQHDTINAALAAVQVLQPSPQASLLGRSERVDMANAAMLNGISSHTFDFDDTHLKTIIHPAGPVASALLALGEHTGATGREMIDALVLGIEVSCRVGNAIYPHHYDRGWHITGSTGMLGGAAACSRLLKLNAEQTQMALGIAASQPVGLREQFGTMTKPLHPGAAAKVGLMSALMAKNGFTASRRALEAPRGLMQVFSDKTDWPEITEQLGQRWEITLNTYKPFACGIVIHPAIDACVQLRETHQISPQDVTSVKVRAHPLVQELTGKKTPADGLQAKFSVFHSCAAALIRGRAGEDEYADDFVTNPHTVALRDKVELIVDPAIHEASVEVTICTVGGQTLHLFVEHAIGSLERPMSDDQLRAKFVDQSEPVIGHTAADNGFNLCMALSQQPSLTTLLQQLTTRS